MHHFAVCGSASGDGGEDVECGDDVCGDVDGMDRDVTLLMRILQRRKAAAVNLAVALIVLVLGMRS